MKDALKKITAYNVLIDKVENLRNKTYSTERADDTNLLIEIWNGLCAPDAEFKVSDRIELGPKWKEIGFQGNDPSTDFRGMGMLGLSCLQ
jgi:hypothetical protein